MTSSDGKERTAGTTLPMASIERVMRRAIPEGFRISSSSKQLAHDCTVEFARFVTGDGEASIAFIVQIPNKVEDPRCVDPYVIM